MKTLNCVLLIDDNPDDNFFHSVTIKEVKAANFIKVASNGDKAIDYLQKSKEGSAEHVYPDLIFLDINMPGMNGFEFLEKAIGMGLIAANQPPIVVMLTSSLNPADEKMALEKFSGEIKRYCNKPLEKQALTEILETYFKD